MIKQTNSPYSKVLATIDLARPEPIVLAQAKALASQFDATVEVVSVLRPFEHLVSSKTQFS